jgi:uncharacterized protein YukJ
MLSDYGVLAGKVDIFKREDDRDSPHLQIRVIDRNNEVWRIPVNVLSADNSFLIFHRVDPLVSHPVLASLDQLPPGFNELVPGQRKAANALDFFQSPLFDWPTGIAVAPSKPGENNDLQDSLITDLKNLKAQNGDIFVFGVKFPKPGQPPNPRPSDREFGTKQGMHDIHMNQGNPPGRFEKDNGTFQDGGLILKFANRYVGLFLRFQTQWLPTDDRTGNRLPQAKLIPPGGSLTDIPGTDILDNEIPVMNPGIYIERALVNPIGADPGKEIVVIGNASTADVNISDWQIVDPQDGAEILTGSLPAGESRRIILTGKTAKLGNKGGTIRLKDATGQQIHAVSYAKADAIEGRYVRFIT